MNRNWNLILSPVSLLFSQLNAPGVYFKIGLVDPAFNWGPAFINAVKCSVIFQIDSLLPILRDLGQFFNAERVFPSYRQTVT